MGNVRKLPQPTVDLVQGRGYRQYRATGYLTRSLVNVVSLHGTESDYNNNKIGYLLQYTEIAIIIMGDVRTKKQDQPLIAYPILPEYA